MDWNGDMKYLGSKLKYLNERCSRLLGDDFLYVSISFYDGKFHAHTVMGWDIEDKIDECGETIEEAISNLEKKLESEGF